MDRADAVVPVLPVNGPARGPVADSAPPPVRAGDLVAALFATSVGFIAYAIVTGVLAMITACAVFDPPCPELVLFAVFLVLKACAAFAAAYFTGLVFSVRWPRRTAGILGILIVAAESTLFVFAAPPSPGVPLRCIVVTVLPSVALAGTLLRRKLEAEPAEPAYLAGRAFRN